MIGLTGSSSLEEVNTALYQNHRNISSPTNATPTALHRTIEGYTAL